ncbi:hypothetical protein L7F22_026319 [Adiantum nelumboides]|nr:hypothetical protein [Adiantum nelumboides]
MAPPNIQQLLQGRWQRMRGHFGDQGGPFDPCFDISNFLRDLEHRQSPASEEQQCFRLHFPFPFSGFSFIRKRNRDTQVSDSATIAKSLVVNSNVNLESQNELNKQLLITRNGEDAADLFNHNRVNHNPVPDSSRLQTSSSLSIAMQIEGTGDHDGHLMHVPKNENNFSTAMELQSLRRQLDIMDLASAPASKETLGWATWTFLHTLAAQFPEKPTRQQQRDAKELMAILSRLYPCKECADHFKEVLKINPVQTSSGVELAQWMCRVHNVVNRSLGKTNFPCQRVDARWGALDCDEGACNLQGRMH